MSHKIFPNNEIHVTQGTGIRLSTNLTKTSSYRYDTYSGTTQYQDTPVTELTIGIDNYTLENIVSDKVRLYSLKDTEIRTIIREELKSLLKEYFENHPQRDVKIITADQIGTSTVKRSLKV